MTHNIPGPMAVAAGPDLESKAEAESGASASASASASDVCWHGCVGSKSKWREQLWCTRQQWESGLHAGLGIQRDRPVHSSWLRDGSESFVSQGHAGAGEG
ncbi:hypothetical protein IAQ61_005878 [Plenodomus lingam]|uniref:uncharacterized protein n=1 Tax=Leptosphaeria maculans TaxID=5022 RepID=UPI00331847C2|nr:hypothetical protein IAQ61_005878 [Plenodomus lingam]